MFSISHLYSVVILNRCPLVRSLQAVSTNLGSARRAVCPSLQHCHRQGMREVALFLFSFFALSLSLSFFFFFFLSLFLSSFFFFLFSFFFYLTFRIRWTLLPTKWSQYRSKASLPSSSSLLALIRRCDFFCILCIHWEILSIMKVTYIYILLISWTLSLSLFCLLLEQAKDYSGARDLKSMASFLMVHFITFLFLPSPLSSFLPPHCLVLLLLHSPRRVWPWM